MAATSLARILISAAMLAILSVAPARPTVHAAANTSNPAIGPVASSVFYPEVRLRKLHLVRPDLIPYPIYYAIYC